MDHPAAPARGVTVGSYASRPLAELARAYLADHDIVAAVDADDGNGTQPEVGFVTGGARVVVAPDAVDAAVALLDAVAPRTPSARGRHGPLARWVAATVAGSMALLGVWTVVVLVLF